MAIDDLGATGPNCVCKNEQANDCKNKTKGVSLENHGVVPQVYPAFVNSLAFRVIQYKVIVKQINIGLSTHSRSLKADLSLRSRIGPYEVVLSRNLNVQSYALVRLTSIVYRG